MCKLSCENLKDKKLNISEKIDHTNVKDNFSFCLHNSSQ